MSRGNVETFFYVLVECSNCGEDVHYGPNLTLLSYRDRPVVPVGMIEQTRVDCPRCGATTWYGELDYETEVLEPDEFSDDDDANCKDDEDNE